MLNFIMYLFVFAASVFLLAVALRFGLKGAAIWDEKIVNKANRTFTGFMWFYRIPFAIGVIPEYFFWLALGNNNYFRTNWWALKTSSFISFLVFLALLSHRSEVELYYSFTAIAESGLTAYFTSGITFWYLNMLNLMYLSVFILIIIESIRMHRWYAPLRIIMYTVFSLQLVALTMISLSLIIIMTLLYVAYKIIKFLFFSKRRKKYQEEEDDDEDISETLNNNYRIFRAELYAWEDERKSARSSIKKEEETIIKRKKPRIKRKPRSKPKNNDIPRFHPE